MQMESHVGRAGSQGQMGYPQSNALRKDRPIGPSKGHNRSVLHKKAPNDPNFMVLDPSQLNLLDLNTNVSALLPESMKTTVNLSSALKGTAMDGQSKMSTLRMDPNYNQNVKHLYEMGPPQIAGAYIKPLQRMASPQIPLSMGHPLANELNQSISFPASPFFQPPNLMNGILPNGSSSFLPCNLDPMNFHGMGSMHGMGSLNNIPSIGNMHSANSINSMNEMCHLGEQNELNEQNTANALQKLNNINSNPSLFGLPSYAIPSGQPQKLTVTTIPNKDKDQLEREAKTLKQLLNSSSQGIVNANPDYQAVMSPCWMDNGDRNLPGMNDKESDFSFGKLDNLDNLELMDDDLNLNDEYYDSNENQGSQESKAFNAQRASEYYSSNCAYSENYFNQSREQASSPKKEGSKKVHSEKNAQEQAQEREQELDRDREQGNETLGLEKKDSTSSIKKYEPSVCFKNSKKYVNIRLGRPKSPYVTNSSDPIDKKLRDWHNTHNSQISWKKIRRGIYCFGKTEVALHLVHDKIVVKKIDGKNVKDNLLTVEKFVSLNELNELQREENENEEESNEKQTN